MTTVKKSLKIVIGKGMREKFMMNLNSCKQLSRHLVVGSSHISKGVIKS